MPYVSNHAPWFEDKAQLMRASGNADGAEQAIRTVYRNRSSVQLGLPTGKIKLSYDQPACILCVHVEILLCWGGALGSCLYATRANGHKGACYAFVIVISRRQ